MQLIRRLREDDSGSVLITALMCTVVMLALGLALLSIVDTQASQSATERTRDRGFNLAESVLNSEAFVLGRSWPTSGAAVCGASGAGFGDTLGSTTALTGSNAPAALLRPNLDASYTDAAYAGAKWQVNICDDTNGSSVWSESYLANKGYDDNGGHPNSQVWVRAQATVDGKVRVVAGLVQVKTTSALNAKYGLVSGALSDDLSSTTAAITSNGVVTALTNGLINTNPPVAADAVYPVPASGVTGVRCGLLDQVNQLKTCVTGAIGALSSVPLVDTLVTQKKYEQFPALSSTTPGAIGQLRTQAKAPGGVYMPTAAGASPTSSTDDSNVPSCAITGATSSSVVFIEKVGNGDQYCYVDVSGGVTYKALVIGSGRVIIRGSNSITQYTLASGSTNPANLFTGVIYALNLQTSNPSAATPTTELVRVERAARVKGAVHADGKNATVGLVAPEFDTTALINGLFCPGLTCGIVSTVTGLLNSLGLSGTLDAIINGTCVGVKLGSACVGVKIPGLGLSTVLGGITAQLTTYGSAIHSDVETINALKVYGASGVMAGTFRDLEIK